MTSEIEVVEEVESRDHGQTTSLANGAGEIEEESLRNDVYTAAAYGDMEKLQRLVESEGCSVSEPDHLGYYALQWAALNNRTAAAQYIIERGGDVNAADHTGQTALHWSAVRGAIQVAELLLQEGARVNAADIYGFQSTHVAAQYGQTSFIYYIVTKWNADPDVPDNDGRSPLHWAAYKGFADCIRFLLFLDVYRGRRDKEGCTPLHWAAIRGNLEACTVLVHAGKKEDLMLTDNTGLTPAQLASDKNHRQVAFFLGNARRLLDERDGNSRFGKLSKLGLAPVIWCIIFLLLMTYIHSVVMASNLPKLTSGMALIAWLGVLLATSGLVLFYRCSTKDPGYIKINARHSQDMKDDEPLLKIEINNPALLAGNWSQLCSTCKIVKPLERSTVLSVIVVLSNLTTIALGCLIALARRINGISSFFLVLEVSAMLITGAVALTRVLTDPLAPSSFGAWLNHAGTEHVGATSFLVADFFLFSGVAVLTVVQASQISRNITTNEVANMLRYSYLRAAGGHFRNPYDHGCKKNCSDFLIGGCNVDVEGSEESSQSEGIGMMNIVRSPYFQNGAGHSHQVNGSGDGHIVVNLNKSTNGPQGHVHSSGCSHKANAKTDYVPLGLGIGLGRHS